MAPRMKELGIDRLSPEERLALVQEIWDSLATDLEQAPVSDEVRQLLEARLRAHEAAPEAVVPWEEVRARALKRAAR